MNLKTLLLVLNLFFLICDVKAQSLGPDTAPGDPVSSFQPSLAVVIGIMSIMFSLTFILLLYARTCHNDRGGFVLGNNSQQNLDLASARSPSGIDKIVVESLPFFKFSSLKGSRGGLECAVCLSKFEDIEILRLLPKCRHAFHIGCVDQWLEKHSSCPLCRHKVCVEDIAVFMCSDSFRFLQADSDVELFVQREEDHHGSSRFSVGSSFRRIEKGRGNDQLNQYQDHEEDDQKVLLQKLNDEITNHHCSSSFSHGSSFIRTEKGCEYDQEEDDPKVLLSEWNHRNCSSSCSHGSSYRRIEKGRVNDREGDQKVLLSELNHRNCSSSFSHGSSYRRIEKGRVNDREGDDESNHAIVDSDITFKNRLSNISSSDLVFLNSEMLHDMSIKRFSDLGSSANDPLVNTTSARKDEHILKIGTEIRSMSDITGLSRFGDRRVKNRIRETCLIEDNVKEARMRSLWLLIARKRVEWFADRENRTQQFKNSKIPEILHV